MTLGKGTIARMGGTIPYNEGLDAVARDHRRTTGVRLIICFGGAALFGANLGWGPGLLLFALMMACEAATLWVIRADADRTGAKGALQQLAAGLATSLVWTGAAVVYWRDGGFAGQVVALVQLCALLTIAQNMSFKSPVSAIVFGVLPAVALVTVPALGGFAGAQLVVVALSVMLALLYLVNDTIDNMRHGRQLRETRAALEAQTARAEAANQAKSAFVAMLSHELRTPMNGVLGMARALDGTRLTARQREHVRLLVSSGETLLTMLNGLLDMAKIEAGKIELESTPLDLRDLASECVALWDGAARAKSLDLRLDYAAGAPRAVVGDPIRLRQVLANLISNALKFTETGEVVVAVRVLCVVGYEASLEVSVSDTGIGMTADQLARVFEPFAQADTTTARQFGGTGLGLSICRQLTGLMGGEITAESVPGEGSVFRVRLGLPLASVVGSSEPADLEATGLRVLVADDNAVNLAVARSVLEAVGAEVATAENGAAALDALRTAIFDVVLMDVNMPGMDGIEALRRIRDGEVGRPDQPVVALTADAVSGTETALLAHGFDAVAAKPIAPQALVEAMASACEGRALAGAQLSAAPQRSSRGSA